jgi:hypothetical protein
MTNPAKPAWRKVGGGGRIGIETAENVMRAAST